MRITVGKWFQGGSPWVWLNAGAVAISLVMVVGLLALIAVRGLGHFWPSAIVAADYRVPGQESRQVLGQLADSEAVSGERLRGAGLPLDPSLDMVERSLIKVGNRDVTGSDFCLGGQALVAGCALPGKCDGRLSVVNGVIFYGYLKAVREGDKTVATGDTAWEAFQQRIARALAIHDQIYQIEKHDIGSINARLERLRLKERSLELKGNATPAVLAGIEAERGGAGC